MNLIRKLKISDIVPVEFSELEQGIIDLFNDNLSDLVVFIDESKPDEINYMKSDGTFIMQQDNKNHILRVRNDGFWSVLKFYFGFTNIDIEIIMKSMIEKTLKYKVSELSYTIINDWTYEVERKFKNNLIKLKS